MALAVVASGRNLLLEGPVGVGKTTVALAICAHLGRDTVRVDGDDRYSEEKLCGWFDPPTALRLGYTAAAYTPGPLVTAMRSGSVLFVNELNRMPENVQNVLLPALDERFIHVPHVGTVHAAPGFQVIATQNPAEYVGTGHLSWGLRDRFERLAVGYQPAAEERDIVTEWTGCEEAALVEAAVRLTRATRLHPRFVKGASVRGAIAIVAIAGGLRAAADAAGDGNGGGIDRAVLRRAMESALHTRVDLRPEGDSTLTAALDDVFRIVVDRGEDPDLALAPGASDEDGCRVPAPEDAHREQPPPVHCDPDQAMVALATRFGLPGASVDGWQVACNLTRTDCGITDQELRRFAEQLAAGAVMSRATRLVGPLRGATRLVRENPIDPHVGELDVQATVENMLGKPFPEPGDWVIQRREERHHQVCLMVDASPSMEGENMAIAAVAAAVLVLKLRPEDVSVVLFNRVADTVTRLGVADPPHEVVRRMLAKRVRPRTNITAGLQRGAAELERGNDPRRCGLLITDGVPTMGGDPVPHAHMFPRLFVLHTEGTDLLPSQERSAGPLCRRLADAGRGDVFPVCTYRELPRRLLDLANRMLR